MKIKLKQKFPPSTDFISRYQRLLELSHKILDSLSINVEKILYAKIDAIPKVYLSPQFEVATPEIVELTLDNAFRIVDYDKTVDISKLAWKYSELRAQFIGTFNGMEAIFHLSINYKNKIELKGHTNELDFDEFDELLRRAWSSLSFLTDLLPALKGEVWRSFYQSAKIV